MEASFDRTSSITGRAHQVIVTVLLRCCCAPSERLEFGIVRLCFDFSTRAPVFPTPIEAKSRESSQKSHKDLEARQQYSHTLLQKLQSQVHRGSLQDFQPDCSELCGWRGESELKTHDACPEWAQQSSISISISIGEG